MPERLSLLHSAVLDGDVDVVRRLLEYGPRNLVSSRSPDARSTLLLACSTGNPTVVKLVLERLEVWLERETGMPKAANALFIANDRDGQGNSALHQLVGASSPGSSSSEDVLKCLLLLLERGLRADARNSQGLTPLHLLCRNSRLGTGPLAAELAEVLLLNGGHVNAVDADGVSPLLLASVSRAWDLARVLLAWGGDLNLSAPSNAPALTAPSSVPAAPSSPMRSPRRRASPVPVYASASASASASAPPPPPPQSLAVSPTPKMCRRFQLAAAGPSSPEPSASASASTSASASASASAVSAQSTPPPPPPPPPAFRSPKRSPVPSHAHQQRARGDSMVALLEAINASAYRISASDMIPRQLRRSFFAMMDASAQSAVPPGEHGRCQECARPLLTQTSQTQTQAQTQAQGLTQTKTQGKTQPLTQVQAQAQAQAQARSCVHCRRVVCAHCCRFAYPQTLVQRAAAATGSATPGKLLARSGTAGRDGDCVSISSTISGNIGSGKENPILSQAQTPTQKKTTSKTAPAAAPGQVEDKVCEACVRAILDNASAAHCASPAALRLGPAPTAPAPAPTPVVTPAAKTAASGTGTATAKDFSIRRRLRLL